MISLPRLGYRRTMASIWDALSLSDGSPKGTHEAALLGETHMSEFGSKFSQSSVQIRPQPQVTS